MSADGKPQPGAPVTPGDAGIGLTEHVEDHLPFGIGNADAAVGDRKEQTGPLALLIIKAHLDRSPLGKFHRIAHQIDQHLTDAALIAHHQFRQPCIDCRQKLNVLDLGLLFQDLHHLPHQLARIKAVAGELHLSRLDAGEIQNIVDQVQQRRTGPLQHLGILLLLRVKVALQQQIAHTDHHIHRRADFVTHGGQKFAFGAVGLSGLLHGSGQDHLHLASLLDLLLEALVVVVQLQGPLLHPPVQIQIGLLQRFIFFAQLGQGLLKMLLPQKEALVEGDAVQQLIVVNGLCQVVHCSGLVALAGKFLGLEDGGDENDGDIAGATGHLQMARRLIAVHARHLDIQQDQIHRLFDHHGQGLIPGGGFQNGAVPQSRQQALQGKAVVGVVIHHQQLKGGGRHGASSFS